MGALRDWLNDSFRRRIAVVVSLLALGLGGSVLVISYFEVLGISRGLTADRLVQLGEQLGPLLGRGPRELVARAGRVAGDSAVGAFVASGGLESDSAAAAVLRKEFPADDRIAVVLLDSGGRPLLQHHRAGAPPWFGAPAVRPDGAGDSQSPVLGPHQRLSDSATYYDVGAAIRRGDTVVGYLIRRQQSQLSQAGRQTFSVILGEGTELVLGSAGTGVWNDLARVIPPPAESLRTGQPVWYSWEGDRYLALAMPIQGTPWTQIVRTRQAVVAAPAREYLGRGAIIAGLIVLLGTLSGVALGRTLGRPIQEVTAIAERIASAEDPSRVDESVPGEAGRLARAFNAMVDRLGSSVRRLRENESSLRAFVAHASAGIWRVEFVPAASTNLAPAVQIESWYRLAPLAEGNPALARMCGVEPVGETAAIPLHELFPQDDPVVQRLLTDFVRNGYRAAGIEVTQSGQGDNRRIFVNDLIGIIESGGLRRIWGIRRDISVERLLDERLAQTDRLEAIGRLAGGIAHDFNNLLTAIIGFAESLEERFPSGDSGRKDAREITGTAQRASELTRQLLAFSRGQVMRPALIDLNAVVRSAEGLLRRVIGEDIEVRLQLAESLDAVEADPGQIERVIVNLAVNARDAMPEGGRIELRTASAAIDEEHARTRPGLVPGDYVVLAVSDTGIGMSEEVRLHIFEPFFTTKPKGKGTGLGLSTVYGIVRQSGGDIVAYSEEGQGTTFRIYLPVRGRVQPAAVRAAPPGTALADTGSETILLVEDEEPVREVTRRALAGAGYTVLAARDGAEALQIEAQHPDPIHLVLTDMILPGLTGRELAVELRSRRPGIRLLIMSGYTGDTHAALEGLPPDIGYLEKPFSLADLRLKVREALDTVNGEQ